MPGRPNRGAWRKTSSAEKPIRSWERETSPRTEPPSPPTYMDHSIALDMNKHFDRVAKRKAANSAKYKKIAEQRYDPRYELMANDRLVAEITKDYRRHLGG